MPVHAAMIGGLSLFSCQKSVARFNHRLLELHLRGYYLVSPNLRSLDAIPPRLRWNNVISSFMDVPSLYNFVNRASSFLLHGLY